MNEQIRKARDVALSILKPSQKDIEHGTELHENSLVFESYGFAPRCVIDGDKIKAGIEAGASADELQHMREDMLLSRCADDPREREEHLMAWDAAGVTCVFQNAGEECQSITRMMQRLAHFTYATDMMRDSVPKAVTPDDVVVAKERNCHCLYFSANGVPLVEHWNSVEDELRYIRVFFELGIRMMHLTYNRRNMLGDGCAEPANGGLSDLGRAAVAEMNRVGVIVDVAHSGWQTSLEAAKASVMPMVVSHSVCAALNAHARSKPDEVIRAICDTGGFIGICCIPAFLGGNGDIGTFLEHIDHVIKTFGADHVTIGTDVAYTSPRQKEEWEKVDSFPKARTPLRSLWPENDPLFDEKWHREEMEQSMAWTNWPLFTVGMVQRGYSDEDIQKVLGGNVMRVARAALETGS